MQNRRGQLWGKTREMQGGRPLDVGGPATRDKEGFVTNRGGEFSGREGSYPLCGETLEPLARFVRKLPMDSNLAEDSFRVS